MQANLIRWVGPKPLIKVVDQSQHHNGEEAENLNEKGNLSSRKDEQVDYPVSKKGEQSHSQA